MTTRRDILRSGAVLAAVSLAVVPVALVASVAAEVDPIFAAIETHRAAYVAFGDALKVQELLEESLPASAQRTRLWGWDDDEIVATDDPAWIECEQNRRLKADAEQHAALELAGIVPTTKAGIIALLQYAVAHIEAGNLWPSGLEDSEQPYKTGLDWSYFVHCNIAEALEANRLNEAGSP